MSAPLTVAPGVDVLALGTGAELPRDAALPVHELVEQVAARDPEAVAVLSGGAATTYRDLDRSSMRIARRLAAMGAGREARVAVLCRPSAGMIAAVLGVLRAGAAYVPIDDALPAARIAAVLADAGVVAAVADGSGAARLPGLPLVRVDEADGDEPGADLPDSVAGDDAAYVIYTSGSTGEPKGVVVEHRQLAASTAARRVVYPGAATFLLVSPLSFDSSVAGLWGTLTTGGRLVVPSAEDVRDPERLVGLIAEHGVTRLLCVPSLYRVLLDAATRLGAARLASLETVVVAGETLPEALVRRHFEVAGGASLVNEYGPTEATVWATFHRFAEPGPVVIGRPVDGVRLYVLDDALRPVPPGVDGELFIGGAFVARGYLNRADATMRAFLPDPYAGGRMYRTGDVVRWNAEGELVFVGRRDHQVKIRGHRVEPAAVEAELRALPGVRDAVVVPTAARTELTCFVVAEGHVDGADLRRQLADRLPAVMVPAAIEVVEQFPLTTSGKVDRDGLAARAERTRARIVAGGERDEVTAQVAAAWSEVLKVSDVPTDVNFFDVGGHSLTMFELKDALERRTGAHLSVVALFRHTTVAAQAAMIRDAGAAPETTADADQSLAARRAQALRARRERAERGRTT